MLCLSSRCGADCWCGCDSNSSDLQEQQKHIQAANGKLQVIGDIGLSLGVLYMEQQQVAGCPARAGALPGDSLLAWEVTTVLDVLRLL
jgi:hypothetical protein